MTAKAIKLKIAHSPDSDDAFMFYAIRHKKIDLKNYQFEFDSAEIELLNQQAFDTTQAPDIIAVSFHAFAYLEDYYSLLISGSSMGGKEHGPKLISKASLLKDLRDKKKSFANLRIAIPGKFTSAYLSLRLYENISFNEREKFQEVFCNFDKVFDLVATDEVDAGLLIHESQLKFQEQGYESIIDLGQWWYCYTEGLNLPLGCNIIKKSLGQELISDIDELLMQSILWGKENFTEVMNYSRDFAKNELNDENAKKYLDMYVNDSTIKLNKEDIESINLFLKLGKEQGLIKTNFQK